MSLFESYSVGENCFILDGFCRVPPLKEGIHTVWRDLSAAYSHLFSGEFSNLQINETSQNKPNSSCLKSFKVLTSFFPKKGKYINIFNILNILTMAWPQTLICKCFILTRCLFCLHYLIPFFPGYMRISIHCGQDQRDQFIVCELFKEII